MIHTITIPASEVRPVRLQGTYFCCISCTADFSLRLDNEALEPVSPGTRFQRARVFAELLFVNLSGVANDVTFWVGSTPYEAPAVAANLPAASIAALATALTALRTLTPSIDNLSNESHTYTNFVELAVVNTGTINITVAGETIEPGYGASWAAGRFDQFGSLTVNCTGVGGAARVVFSAVP